MANIKSLFHSVGKTFWFNDNKDTDAQDIGGIMDLWSNLRGVDCDGAVNGISFPTGVGPNTSRMTFELIEGVNYLIVRSCDGTLLFKTASDAID